ncbi:hypothetical protein TCAL_00160 [Tigriopus californicus]|uniref:C2H2-type domain-containing protein n=1 Tax=Tigriopus californicus TaxID=6832 RepID=A0A553PI55_TIGCA|nr:zinc finger protein 268-like [Tigriopus californicus]TRY77360.1 hypothetical protein TCAL_00160 [Tigriopus californicus]|eukprot:TCALIF_00160-PA protein Name:"Similar to ZBTB40 Zinc finger and BTB domain-containing protein 40 (Homo sapiens)" AED:0.08 eAED:0.08 QI:0/-1/0/1/-1/1/1/0/266
MNSEREIKQEKTVDEEDEEDQEMYKDDEDDDDERGNPTECNFCNKFFPNASDLETHKNLVHFQRDVFQCQKCETRFMSKVELNAHLPVHIRKRLRQKPNEFLTEVVSIIKRGKVLGQHQTNMPDPDLEKRPPAAIHSHGKVFRPAIYSRSSYTCGECQEAFTSSSELMLHLDLHPDPEMKVEPTAPSSSKTFPCGFCKEAFPSKKWALIHTKYHHSTVNASKLSLAQKFIRTGVNCSACSSSFLKLDEYYNHLLENHGSVELHKIP